MAEISGTKTPEPDQKMNLSLPSTLKNPILDIAASFWDDARYQAFRACYRSMRIMDDLVDDAKSSGGIPGKLMRAEIGRRLNQALKNIETPEEAFKNLPPEMAELRETIERFKIPLWPWRRLARSMAYDLTHNGFDTFLSFARYAKGAAVSPASVFIHLIGLSEKSGVYTPAPVDCYTSARPLAMFSYMTHIMRDFRDDFALSLEYIPLSMRKHFDISHKQWESAGGGIQSDNFTSMIAGYHKLAAGYREKSRPASLPIYSHLDAEYRYSLEVIWELYAQIHDNIKKANFQLDPALIHPSAEDVFARLESVGKRLNLDTQHLKRGAERLGMPL